MKRPDIFFLTCFSGYQHKVGQFEPVDESLTACRLTNKAFLESLILRGVPAYGGSRMLA